MPKRKHTASTRSKPSASKPSKASAKKASVRTRRAESFLDTEAVEDRQRCVSSQEGDWSFVAF